MRWVTVLLVGAVGCGGTPGTPSGVDAPITSDQALHLAWTSTPGTIPGSAGNGITITRASFSGKNLRIVGDAGATNVRDHVPLLWAMGTGGEGAQVPPTLDFPEAPAGIYSRVVFDLSPTDDMPPAVPSAFEIDGTVVISAQPAVPFQIIELIPLSLSIELDNNVTLEPNMQATVTVGIDLKNIVGAVDYGSLNMVGGTLVLSDADLQMITVRTKVQEAFRGNDH